MQPLELKLPEQFYDAGLLKQHCGSFLAWKETGPVAVIDPADDIAWEKLNLALRESLGKVIHCEIT